MLKSVIYVNDQCVLFLHVSCTVKYLFFVCKSRLLTLFALSSGLLADKWWDLGEGNMEKEYTSFIYRYCTTNIVTIQSCLKIGKGLQVENKML